MIMKKKNNKRQESLPTPSDLKYEKFFEVAQSGLMFITGDRKLIKANQRLAEMFGYNSAQEMVGLSMRELHDNEENYNNFGKEHFASLSQHKNLNIEHLITRKDGSQVWVSISGRAIDDNYPADLSKGVLWSFQDISLHKSIEEQLRIERDKAQDYLDMAGSIIIALDTEGNIVLINRAGCALLETSESELLGKNWFENYLLIDDIDAVKEIFRQLINRNIENVEFVESKIRTAMGNIRDIAWHNGYTLSPSGEVTGLLSSGEDITQSKHLQQKLEKNYEELKLSSTLLEDERFKYKTILDLASDGISIMNKDGHVVECSKQAASMLGYNIDEIKHLHVSDWDKDITPEEYQQAFHIQPQEVMTTERTHIRKDGTTYLAQINISLIKFSSQTYIYTAVRDITEQRKNEQYLKQQSITDELTGLYNRKKYTKHIAELLEEFKRYKTTFSLLIIDLDNFKSVNDTYGHAKGDEVLIEISAIFKSMTRTNDYAYRIGGEEFAILVTNTNKEGAVIMAENIRTSIESAHFLKERRVTISIGVAEVIDIDSVDTLFKRADDNLYYAKQHGRNKVIAHI